MPGLRRRYPHRWRPARYRSRELRALRHNPAARILKRRSSMP
ncbi:MAG: hypothetical protein AVDCRST_MAG19-65 [uncultured Thermomicrobiales bacterium]|uniref:Uncharacterized protein n=1 Tax=uncultured Thermomicrobiales bacterium TaxID=1645740 RepID=A0A6J4U861_9BACT|nr:MAG: hypothetical protein AVDCRST_MAG19-65 [uncultured Thermomicrobiales bacterium]